MPAVDSLDPCTNTDFEPTSHPTDLHSFFSLCFLSSTWRHKWIDDKCTWQCGCIWAIPPPGFFFHHISPTSNQQWQPMAGRITQRHPKTHLDTTHAFALPRHESRVRSLLPPRTFSWKSSCLRRTWAKWLEQRFNPPGTYKPPFSWDKK